MLNLRSARGASYAALAISIGIGVIIMIIVPFAIIAGQNENTATLAVQESVNNFTDKIATKGEITEEDVQNFIYTINSIGTAGYEADMKIQIPDDNPAKKSSSSGTVYDGTTYITIYATQINEELSKNNVYKIPEGSIVNTEVRKVKGGVSDNLDTTMLLHDYVGGDVIASCTRISTGGI